jgi:hypothetical protein
MITGKLKQPTLIKPEVNYRKLSALNYSMLKVWDENPTLFFEQFKLGKLKKDKRSASLIIGDIAHFYVLDCGGSEREFENRMEEKFAQVSFEIGSGQVFILCDHLFNVTEESMNEEGVITMALEDRFEEAFKRVKAQEKYKGKDIEAVWTDFEKNGQDYFKERMNNLGKTIVTPTQLEKGKFVGNNLLNDPNTSDIFKGRNVHTSYPIEWVFTNGDCSEVSCKSELDLLKIDDKKQKIYLYDLKCTWDNEGFDYSYLKFYYYLQQAYYWLAAQYYFSHIEPQYLDYEIVPMQYVVADTSLNNRRPLIYPCSERDLKAGIDGFHLAHKHYKGVKELMDEICFAENNNIWNMSKQAFENKGIMNLNFNYL